MNRLIFISNHQAVPMAKSFGGDLVLLALSLLPQAAQLSYAPISNFHVGAIAIDANGNLYFGANQECTNAAMAQTVHAEQSAIAHAWMREAPNIAHLVVNHTPCGHCRQFLNELNSAKTLRIHLPHSRNNPLHTYLPDGFGPDNLNSRFRLLDKSYTPLHYMKLNKDNPLFQHALHAAEYSYAPYSQAHAGIALQCSDGTIYSGRYAENAAYNPTLPPLQTALNLLRLNGHHDQDISNGLLVCTQHGGHDAHTRALWTGLGLPDATLHTITVQTA